MLNLIRPVAIIVFIIFMVIIFVLGCQATVTFKCNRANDNSGYCIMNRNSYFADIKKFKFNISEIKKADISYNKAKNHNNPFLNIHTVDNAYLINFGIELNDSEANELADKINNFINNTSEKSLDISLKYSHQYKWYEYLIIIVTIFVFLASLIEVFIKLLPAIQNTTQHNPPKVIVIDDFLGANYIDFDKDGKNDYIRHGEVVKSFITCAIVECIDAGSNPVNFPEILKHIRKRVSKKEPILAINISLGLLKSVDSIKKLTGLNLNSENFEDKTSDIINQLRKLIDKPDIDLNEKFLFKAIVDIYYEIDYLAELGVATVIAAGNNQDIDNVINLFALNPRAILVGGSSMYSSQNERFDENIPLADLHTKGVFTASDLADEVLLNLTTVQDFMAKNPYMLFEEVKKNIDIRISGTSYSSPFVLNFVVKMIQQGMTIDEINTTTRELYRKAISLNIPVEKLLEEYYK
ncbi:MAG: hypothetical protein AB1782_20830 [Cyanobacteriota bacterium]